MRGDDKADDDEAKQVPRRASRKEMAEGREHLVKIR
jgi:hypothetical protein